MGPLQFDVALHRLRREFGAPAELSAAPWQTARRTDTASARVLGELPSVMVVERSDGEQLALFESPYWLQRLQADHPDLVLKRLVRRRVAP